MVRFIFRSLFITFFLLASVCASLFARNTEASLWRFVHPGAKALVGIQWGRVQKSEVGRWVQKRWINSETIPGIEFLKDIDEVLISSTGALAGSPDSEPPMLIAVQGHFDRARVQHVLTAQHYSLQTFNGVPVYRDQGKPVSEPAFALIGQEIVLIGDAQSLFSTIERSQSSAFEESGPLLSRARLLATRYDCWAVMSEPGAMKNFLFASLAGKTLSPDSQSFEAGISVKDGLAIDVVLGVTTERAARQLAAKLSRMVRMASAGHAGSAEFAGIFEKLRVTTEHSDVMMSVRLNQQETIASLVVPAEPTVAAAEAKPAPVIEQRRVIRIEGLDEGPREIVVKTN